MIVSPHRWPADGRPSRRDRESSGQSGTHCSPRLCRPPQLPRRRVTPESRSGRCWSRSNCPHSRSVHLSSSNVTSNRRVEFREAFESAVDVACERGVDAVVQTGELFATRSPADRDVDVLVESLERLERAGITFVHQPLSLEGDIFRGMHSSTR